MYQSESDIGRYDGEDERMMLPHVAAQCGKWLTCSKNRSVASAPGGIAMNIGIRARIQCTMQVMAMTPLLD